MLDALMLRLALRFLIPARFSSYPVRSLYVSRRAA